MKFSYRFSNLFGTVYRKGNVLFTHDGNSVISPVGNRITIYDLKNNKTRTLPVESQYNYTSIGLSPNGALLLAVNEDGEAHLISLTAMIVIHKYQFKRPIKFISFSPDGKYFAVCKENKVFVFSAPGMTSVDVNPFIMERVFTGSYDETTCIDWSYDSRIIAVGSKDMCTKLYALQKYTNFRPYTLGSHTEWIVGCFFEKNSYHISTVSRNGQVCIWECSIDEEELIGEQQEPMKKKSRKEKKSGEEEIESEDDIDTSKAEMKETEKAEPESGETEDETTHHKFFYKRLQRHYLMDLISERGVKLTTAQYHKGSKILVTGFSNGSFFLHELPEVNLIHSLSISDQSVTTISINNTGDWIAIACSGLGQLLVWEWQCETYVLKQQGHFNNMNCLSYSSDGQYIVTGGDDGKVKLWNTSTGFCFVTFSDHTSPISGVQFSNNRKVIVSASLDGTVRAYDMTRYRNFKTFTSPRPVQFSCVALDTAGEFVAAGGQDMFDIYLWSMKIGRLIEILSGHEGPISSLTFNPVPGSSALASVSWDKTLRLWNAIESGGEHETIYMSADCLCVVYRPDGLEVAVATLDGQISFFNTVTSQQTGCIEGRNDLGSGRSDTDVITAKKSLQGKAFSSLCYTADGKCILAGGQSKYVCIYSVPDTLLVKKFEITQNRSFDAVDDVINRRQMTEFGNIALIDEREDENDPDKVINLPGVKKGDMASRAFKPEVRVFCLQFSPTGQEWAAATTEGLLIYSQDIGLVFDPFQLEMGITPESLKKALLDKDYTRALMMAIKLNEVNLIQEVVESVNHEEISLTIRNLPESYIERTVRFLGSSLDTTRHIEFYLSWIQEIFSCHGNKLKGSCPNTMPILLLLQKNLTRKYEDIGKICDYNKFTLQYLVNLSEQEKKEEKEEPMDVLEEDYV